MPGHADNSGLAEFGQQPGQRQAPDDRTQVEEGRAHRGHEEFSLGVEHAHHHRRQRYKEQEGKHDLGQFDGELGFADNLGKIRCEQADDRSGPVQPHQGEGADQQGEKDQHVASQPPCGLGTTIGAVVGEDGDKGSGKGSFGKEIAQQIGDPEGHHKGIDSKTRAEHSGENLFTDEAKHPAAHHGDTHSPGGTGNFSG